MASGMFVWGAARLRDIFTGVFRRVRDREGAPLPPPVHRSESTLRFEDTPPPPPVSVGLPRGTAIGRYLLVERLGEGGMGVVYAAYDPQLDRKVALKILREGMGEGSQTDYRARLLREAQAMAKLSHPCVIAVHDVGTYEGHVFVAMEMAPGGTLTGWLRAAPRDWREILAVFLQAGEGLAAAHRAGLVHRDFKPDNVLIGEGRVRVTDFGIARSGSSTAAAALAADSAAFASTNPEASPLTVPGTLLGTAPYMSPEQFAGAGISPRSDQFSFCVALYEALYGVRPFPGKSLGEMREAVTRSPARPPPKSSRVPNRIGGALLRGLSTDPAARFDSMPQLLSELRKDPRAASRRRAAGALAVLLALGGAAGLQWHLKRHRRACEQQAASLDHLWDAGSRQNVRASFLATGAPLAEPIFQSVSTLLDRSTRELRAAFLQTCLATRGRSTSSAFESNIRSNCVERRAEELRAVTALFARADSLVVRNAATTAAGLAPPSHCLLPPSAAESASLRTETPGRERLEAPLRLRLAKVEALRLADKTVEALGEAEVAVKEARAAQLPRMEAEALLAQATLEWELGRPAALPNLRQSFWLAESQGQDELAAQGRIRLLRMLTQSRAGLEEARLTEREAQAAVQRLGGGHPTLEVELLWRRAALRELEGNWEEAISINRAALERFEQLYGPDHPRAGEAFEALARSYRMAGHHAEALAFQRRRRESVIRHFGRDSRQASRTANSLGLVLFWSGDAAGALAELRESYRIDSALFGSDHPHLWMVLSNMGEALQRLGRHAEALEMYQRAKTLASKDAGFARASRAEISAGLARSHLAAKRWRDALPLLEDSLQARESARGDRANLAQNQFDLAQVLWELGSDRPRALALARAARESFAAAASPDPARLQEIEQWLARRRPPSTAPRSTPLR